MRFPRRLIVSLLTIIFIAAGCSQAPTLPPTENARPTARTERIDERPYTSREQLTRGEIGEDIHAAPLPNGAGVVFSSNRHGPAHKLYLQSTEGSRVQRLTHGHGHDGYSAIAPDGRRIAFASNRSGRWQVFLLDSFEDREPTRLTDPGYDSRCPSWSPDGTRIAFSRISPVSGAWEVWVLDLAKSVETYVTDGLFPTWSPDGITLAFQRHRERDEHWYSLWTIRVDGTREQEVVAGRDWGAANPSWSPDGKWIAFNSVHPKQGDDSPRDLYCVRPDGTALRRLTFDDGPEWNPVWAGDGRIYYTARSATGATAIWRLAAPVSDEASSLADR